jgi:phospholipase C
MPALRPLPCLRETMAFLHPVTFLQLAASLLAFGFHSADTAVARPDRDPPPLGVHKIQHVVMIMQENRSFDEYFGTYPGADGIAMKDGEPTVCLPDPQNGGCIAPFHNPREINGGGPHGTEATATDIDGGRMDGFVAAAEGAQEKQCLASTRQRNTASSVSAGV